MGVQVIHSHLTWMTTHLIATLVLMTRSRHSRTWIPVCMVWDPIISTHSRVTRIGSFWRVTRMSHKTAPMVACHYLQLPLHTRPKRHLVKSPVKAKSLAQQTRDVRRRTGGPKLRIHWQKTGGFAQSLRPRSWKLARRVSGPRLKLR